MEKKRGNFVSVVIAIAFLSAVTQCRAGDTDFNRANLKQQLIQELTNTYGLTTGYAHAGKLAIKCTGPAFVPTNYPTLYSTLTNEFTMDKALAWDQNEARLEAGAARIAKFFYGAAASENRPTGDEDRLAQEIFMALTNALPQAPVSAIAGEEYELADQCVGYKSQTELLGKLNDALSRNQMLGLKDNEALRLDVALRVEHNIFRPTIHPTRSPVPVMVWPASNFPRIWRRIRSQTPGCRPLSGPGRKCKTPTTFGGIERSGETRAGRLDD